MNERIKQLAEQAWDDTREKFGSFVDDGGEIDYTFLHAYDQKFAELIVRECAGLCKHESNDDEHDEYDMGMWVKAESIKASIMEHFGVD